MRNKAKMRPKPIVFTALGLSLVAIIFGLFGFGMAMGGGVLGIFIVWFASILGVVAGILLLIGAILGRHRRKLSITVGIAACIVLGISLFTGVSYLRRQIRYPVQKLVEDSSDKGFRATRVECQFGTVRYTIHDPHNQIRFRHGGPPATVQRIGELRVVQFVNTDVSLHCMWNTISVSSQGGKIGGWMGADFAFKSMDFFIDQNGDIQPTHAVAP